MSEQRTYWGNLCRTCRKLIAFDTCSYISFGPRAASMKPGAIRCNQGHNHIYYPRDFCFYPSAVPISEATMEANRRFMGRSTRLAVWPEFMAAFRPSREDRVNLSLSLGAPVELQVSERALQVRMPTQASMPWTP